MIAETWKMKRQTSSLNDLKSCKMKFHKCQIQIQINKNKSALKNLTACSALSLKTNNLNMD
jgi:hypothetical protein